MKDLFFDLKEKKNYLKPELETIVLSSDDALAQSPYDGIVLDRDWTSLFQ